MASVALDLHRSRHGVWPRPRPATVAWGLAGIVAVAVWMLTLRPSTLGGPAGYVMVRGDSMAPALAPGDLVVTRARSTYGPGDVIAYRLSASGIPGRTIVIHRIVGGDGRDGYVTQGDNKPFPDEWRPTDADVVGSTWARVPHIGRLLATVRSPLLLASLAAGTTVALLLVPPARSPYRSRHRRHAHRRRPSPLSRLRVR